MSDPKLTPSEPVRASDGGPRAAYTKRLFELAEDAARCKKKDDAYGRMKLLLLAAAVAVAVVAVVYHTIPMWTVVVPIALFAYFAVVHERVLREVRRVARARAFYERGLARLENRWMGTGQSGEQFLDPRHPYARDLDIFGRGSIFELICTARTRSGEETLAKWLLEPANAATVRARNDAVSELRRRLDIREDLANLGEDLQSGVQPEALARWGEGYSDTTGTDSARAELPQFSGTLRVVTLILSAVGVAGIVAWIVWSIHWLIIAAAIANLALSLRYLKSVAEQVGAVERSGKDLALLAGVLARLEQEQFSAPLLVALRDRLKGDGIRASAAIAKLNKLIQLLESRRNQVVAVLEPFVMWSVQLTFAIVAWRRAHGPSIRKWLEAVGELEALSDLAGYAYEHPTDVFPEFVDEGAGGCFDAAGFAHPLIPEDRAVRNDLKLDREMRLVVISGPNMAGKSTFIRAVGVNAVLAQCGAPVRATRLRLSALTVAASVCILDSLQGGISHFYAEITRLKLITDLARGDRPVLYLLDELLSGTNSHDRRIGAEAIVRSLFERGALGLVTTHDLALAEIVSTLGSAATNAHFEDHLKDGKLGFDHRLSPGIVKTSNALQLMRSIGLEI
jgi:Flp pilus assembly protein TadB